LHGTLPTATRGTFDESVPVQAVLRPTLFPSLAALAYSSRWAAYTPA